MKAENATLVFTGFGLPIHFPLCQDEIHLLRCFTFALDADNGENAAGNIDLDQIALLHESDGSARGRLRAQGIVLSQKPCGIENPVHSRVIQVAERTPVVGLLHVFLQSNGKKQGVV